MKYDYDEIPEFCSDEKVINGLPVWEDATDDEYEEDDYEEDDYEEEEDDDASFVAYRGNSSTSRERVNTSHSNSKRTYSSSSSYYYTVPVNSIEDMDDATLGFGLILLVVIIALIVSGIIDKTNKPLKEFKEYVNTGNYCQAVEFYNTELAQHTIVRKKAEKYLRKDIKEIAEMCEEGVIGYEAFEEKLSYAISIKSKKVRKYCEKATKKVKKKLDIE